MTKGKSIFYFTLIFLLLACDIFCIYYNPISGQNNVYTDITSTFGPRNEPASAYKFHNGIDYRTFQFTNDVNVQRIMIGKLVYGCSNITSAKRKKHWKL